MWKRILIVFIKSMQHVHIPLFAVAVSITDNICASGEEFSTVEVTSNKVFIYFKSNEIRNFHGFALSYSIFPGKCRVDMYLKLMLLVFFMRSTLHVVYFIMDYVRLKKLFRKAYSQEQTKKMVNNSSGTKDISESDFHEIVVRLFYHSANVDL